MNNYIKEKRKSPRFKVNDRDSLQLISLSTRKTFSVELSYINKFGLKFKKPKKTEIQLGDEVQLHLQLFKKENSLSLFSLKSVIVRIDGDWLAGRFDDETKKLMNKLIESESLSPT